MKSGTSLKYKTIQALHSWFLHAKRNFPWRDQPTPYRVLVSEIMLQQTQASVVESYFLRWMTQFPTLQSLAIAPLERVYKAWEGLGYYRRARGLKHIAEFLCNTQQDIPNTIEKLLQLPGIGPYTAGAIASFAFHQKAAAIDGNVMRVLARYFAIQENPLSSKGIKIFHEHALLFLETSEPWVLMEALIELGATLCKKKPLCTTCPLRDSCLAFQEQRIEEFPVKTCSPQRVISTQKQLLLLVHQQQLLLYKEPRGRLLGDLAQFPSFLYSKEMSAENHAQSQLGLFARLVCHLPIETQSFTKYKETLFPTILLVHDTKAMQKQDVKAYFWCAIEELRQLSFTSGHKRVMENFLQQKDKLC